jgi:GNAT superfamily N-acetyltransferase
VTAAPQESLVEIRSPRAADYSRLAQLAGQLGYPSTAAEIAKRLGGMEGARECAGFVAQVRGEVVGWIGVFIYRCMEADARAEINGFIVEERVRSQGVGSQLLARAEEWARQQGCSTIGLKSNVIRERAHKFYERLGYKVVKTQKAFRKDL